MVGLFVYLFFVACVSSGILCAKVASRFPITSVVWSLWCLCGLWESRQYYEAENGAQGLGCTLPLLCVLSGELVGKNLWFGFLPGVVRACWPIGK